MSDQISKSPGEELLFAVRRSVRYHARRRRFFDRLRRCIAFLTVIAGITALAVLLAAADTDWALASAGLVTFLGTIDLILNTAEGARAHAELQRRFMELEMDIVRVGAEPGDQQLREFATRKLRIEMDEPPIMRVLDCVCHNELVRAMGRGEEYEVRLSGAQRFFANFMDISPGRIRVAAQVVSGSRNPAREIRLSKMQGAA